MSSISFSSPAVIPSQNNPDSERLRAASSLPPSVMLLVDTYASTDLVSEDTVSDGYGEFLVFNTSGKELSQDKYNAVYKILNRFSAQNLDKPLEDRPKAIRQQIHAIDPKLDICFIPRTLYELFFMHQAMEEEKNNITEQDNYPICSKIKEKNEKYHHPEMAFPKSFCWHGFNCRDGEGYHNRERRVRNTAYALNQILVHKINPTVKGLSRSTIAELATKEIEYLQENYREFESGKYTQSTQIISGIFSPHCYDEVLDYQIDDANGAVLMSTIDLECSEKAKNSVILYRGGDFEKDETYHIDDETGSKKPYSVSFGTGPFAGTIQDPDASAARNWFAKKNDKYRDAYLFRLPIGGDWKKYFYIPQNNAIAQMFGGTDAFHVRTKIPSVHFHPSKKYSSEVAKGLAYQDDRTKKYAEQNFPIAVSDEELAKAFHAYKVKYGVVLRRANG